MRRIWAVFIFTQLMAGWVFAIDSESSLPLSPRRFDEWDTLPTTVFSAVNGVDPAEGKWAPTSGTPAAQNANTKNPPTARTPANNLEKRKPSALNSSKAASKVAKPGAGKAKPGAAKTAKKSAPPAGAKKKKK